MKPFLDPNDPFFAKPWRRWATSLLPIAWGVFEFWMLDPFWAILFLALGFYALNKLIIQPRLDK